jgi:hypothetical protein
VGVVVGVGVSVGVTVGAGVGVDVDSPNRRTFSEKFGDKNTTIPNITKITPEIHVFRPEVIEKCLV